MKIMSVVASAVLLGSTALVGAAYPAPFVTNGLAGGAIVVGANAAASDMAAAIDLQTSLGTGLISSEETTTDTSSETTFEGENFPLFTGSSKLYLGDAISDVRATLTDTELPELLEEGEFSGNVEADYTQRIELGDSAVLAYAKQPDTSDDDPVIGVSLANCDSADPIYTTDIRFNKIVDFTDEESEGEDLTILGQKFTVGADTDSDELVLFKSSKSVELSVGVEGATSATINVGDSDYIVELISADDDEAVIKVTDTDGVSESKELSEGDSKDINGIDVALTRAHVSEALSKEMAEIAIGAEKMVLKDGSKVKLGVDEDSVKGTEVVFEGTVDALRSIKIKVWENDDDEDAILEGGNFMDPVFNTFGISFTNLNIPFEAGDNETISREEITIDPSDDDVMSVEFTTHNGDEDVFDWYYHGNLSNDEDKIHVVEGRNISEDEYAVVGNEDNGYLVRLTNLEADEDEYSDNEIIFTNAFDSDEEFEVTTLNHTSGDVYIGGKKYLVTYNQTTGVRLDYPDSTLAGQRVVYPTIETSMGAKIAFYESITLDNTTVSSVIAPDGNGYTVSISLLANGTDLISGLYNVTVIGNQAQLTIDGVDNAAIILFEEEDDAGAYTSTVIEVTGTGDDVGINMGGLLQSESDDDIYTNVDVYGTLFTLDDSGDGASLTISYPNDQVYAELFVSEGEATTTTTSTTITPDTNEILVVKDSEVDSVKDRNLIVVGGSCINTVAAKILGGSFCGEEFTDATGVGAGLYLTKVVASPYNAEKIAMLVAGYEAADTTAAVTEVIGGAISTELTV